MLKLIELGEGGNIPAIKEAFDRAVGKPINTDIGIMPDSIAPKVVRYPLAPPQRTDAEQDDDD